MSMYIKSPSKEFEQGNAICLTTPTTSIVITSRRAMMMLGLNPFRPLYAELERTNRKHKKSKNNARWTSAWKPNAQAVAR